MLLISRSPVERDAGGGGDLEALLQYGVCGSAGVEAEDEELPSGAEAQALLRHLWRT